MAASRTSLALLALSLVASAKVERASGFAEGKDLAEKAGAPQLVLVHGSPWQPLSTRLLELVWEKAALENSLESPAVLTTIAIAEAPTEEEAKDFNERHAGWDPKSYSTLPALQIHAADGTRILTRDGRELRTLATPGEFGAFLNDALGLAAKRRELRTRLEGAADDAEALTLIDELLQLPLTPDADLVERLKQLDPGDQLGWQARLGFKPWDPFLREITARIADGEAAAVIEEMEQRLARDHVTPSHRALLLGGKAMALVGLDRGSEAWATFGEALAAAPEDPLARALHRHGLRVAGLPLREAFPTDSALYGREIGENLTRDHASFTLSSSASDHPEHHASLFRGPYAPSGFAFHTGAEKDAHIVIDLHGDCRLRALRIVNRNKIHERAATLTLWTSVDGRTWERHWQAEEPAPAWDILIDEPITTRFLKLGLDRDTPEHLHLRAVDAYGERL